MKREKQGGNLHWTLGGTYVGFSTIYIVLIVALVVYGMLKDSEAAANLLKAITEAFTLLIQN